MMYKFYDVLVNSLNILITIFSATEIIVTNFLVPI